MADRIRVVIADDQPLVRSALRLILEGDPELTVLGEAADGQGALDAARRLRPDIILLAGRLLFVALLYLFLFAIMRTGIGLVKGQRKKERSWGVSVEKGPKELRGVKMSVHGPSCWFFL